jgi:uroporphyrinogen decarboxylase
MLKNDLLLRAARGEKVERTPVWLMRQAGRILPEYREIRSKMGGFKELVENPEFACEVNILVIPQAMGLPYQMIEKQGPWFENTIKTAADIERMVVAEADGVRYTIDAIAMTKKELNGRVPLIGFAGAPWTIFSYMIEGSGSKTFSKAKKFLYTEPVLAHKLLNKITRSTINYLQGQVEAGADIVQVFDSWAGILSAEQYKEFALPYIAQVCDAINNVPVTVFAKGAYFVRKELGELNCETIGLDWNMDIAESRSLIGPTKTLQGNLDPCVLYSDDEVIVAQTKQMLKAFGPERYIANLGHGIYPDIDPSKVKLMVDTVKEFRVK